MLSIVTLDLYKYKYKVNIHYPTLPMELADWILIYN